MAVSGIPATPDGSFRPDQTITRAEIAALIARVLRSREVDITPVAELNFTDRDTIPDWAAGELRTVLGGKLLGGYADGTLRAHNQTTRAEAAVTVNRLLGLLGAQATR